MVFSTGVPERSYRLEELEKTILMLKKMIDAEYSIAQIQNCGPQHEACGGSTYLSKSVEVFRFQVGSRDGNLVAAAVVPG